MEPGLGVQLFEKVKAHMGWDDRKTQLWFDTENPLLGGCTPKRLYQERPEKLARWIDTMIDLNTPPVEQK
jgi:hypothetical protein